MTIDVTTAVHAVDASAVAALFPDRPRLLALGEPTHGEDTLLGLRNRLFRQLVEQEGYRTIALETDCLMGLTVDAYVTSGTGTLEEAMERGFSHEWGAFTGNRDLVRWMRAHNEGRPASERVRFAGFDGPLEITAAASPRQALTMLHSYLSARMDADLLPCTTDTLDRLLGNDARWTEPEAMWNPAKSVGRSADARELRLHADDLATLLVTQGPHLVEASTREEWDRARLCARTATGLLRYHYWMADPSPARMTRLCALRDAMMADNLLALAERGPTLAGGHNGHFQRIASSMQMGGPVEWWGAGALVSRHLGGAYGFLATALGTIRHRDVDAPPPDTVEGLLYGLPRDHCLIDAPKLASALATTPPAARVSPWFGYSPLAPASLSTTDGIVYIKDMASEAEWAGGPTTGSGSGH
ncbi:erythromycin esterase family protein [Streptomyces sp. RFCAC02]|uniref:erythromycin esterase family protein n=1 Tax=Streptomyces sp. RFCAC02 TaxID=2499143 RepID=UPI0010222C10|nr:erythromycin esterase family protein [Streptomyces sp. RFCAC02]